MTRLNPTHKRGTLAVEAALIFPVMILLTFVLIEGGWLMLKAEQIENAARQGARVAALSGSTGTQVTNVVNKIMSDARMAGYSPTVTPDPASAKHGDPITVSVQVPYSAICLTKVPLILSFASTSPVGSSVTMTKE
jgi:Flp pilus assembly protein TadG